MHMMDSMVIHECGGAILTGELDGEEYYYCHECWAFTYDLGGEVPSGTDRAANHEAWDDGALHSPDAEGGA